MRPAPKPALARDVVTQEVEKTWRRRNLRLLAAWGHSGPPAVLTLQVDHRKTLGSPDDTRGQHAAAGTDHADRRAGSSCHRSLLSELDVELPRTVSDLPGPWLGDGRRQGSSPKEAHILQKIDPFVHFRLGIIEPPEVMNGRG